MIQVKSRLCPFCKIEITGKKQKKFCCDNHRNMFNSMRWMKTLRTKAILAARVRAKQCPGTPERDCDTMTMSQSGICQLCEIDMARRTK